MGTVWAILIGIHVCSLLFLAAYLKRLYRHVGKYRMAESKYTLMFGWIRLSYIVFAYVATMGVFIVFSIIFLSLAS